MPADTIMSDAVPLHAGILRRSGGGDEQASGQAGEVPVHRGHSDSRPTVLVGGAWFDNNAA